MALVAAVSEQGEIERLHDVIARQRKAHRADPAPSAAVRRERLRAIIQVVAANRMKIRDALMEDHGSHPVVTTDLVEVSGSMARAQQALDQLDVWMAPEPRPVDASFGDARIWMEPRAKGVIGNMVPWNFPFEIGLGPVAEMFAAGNRVVVKPSELTPHSAQLLRDMIATAFDPDVMTTVLGGPAVAKAFAAADWDHLLYTGSTAVGRDVMRVAAERLTPLTLELGSKSPVILTETGVTARAVQSIIGLKMVKSGQVCVSADHVYAPRQLEGQFVDLARAYVRQNTPTFSRSSDCTGIINVRHFDRLQALLADARAQGAEIIVLEEGGVSDRDSRRMPLTLVTGVTETMRVAQEEIFGPILPIHVYDNLTEVIDRLDRTDKPLTLTIFSEDQAQIDRVLTFTVSGGVSVNGASFNTCCINLGFGGVGASGMGRHHGVEGFREFSNSRAVFIRAPEDHVEVLFPPYGAAAAALVESIFGPT